MHHLTQLKKRSDKKWYNLKKTNAGGKMIQELYTQIQVIKKIPLSSKMEEIFKQYDLIMPKKREEEEFKNREKRRKDDKRNNKRKQKKWIKTSCAKF